MALVLWRDSTTFSHWASADNVRQSSAHTCFAAGFLVKQDKENIVVALLTTEDREEFGNWIVIPAESVVSVTTLKEVTSHD